ERLHAPIAVVRGELPGQLGVEREAPARQRAERRAIAPVEREESPGLARRGAGDTRALDNSDGDVAPGEEVGDRGADDAGAADDDVTGRCHDGYATQAIRAHGPRSRRRVTCTRSPPVAGPRGVA